MKLIRLGLLCLYITVTSLSWANSPVVKLYRLKYQTIKKSITVYGVTTSPRSVTIRSQTDAQIDSINFKPGEYVKKGQLLFSLKLTDIQNQPEKLQATLIQAKSYYDRLVTANKLTSGSISQYDLLKAKTSYEIALAATKEVFIFSKVRAPISGSISDTNMAVGNYISTGTKLVQIIAPNSIELKYQLPDKYSNLAEVGQTVKFKPDTTTHLYKGKVTYISPYFSKSYGVIVRAKLYDSKKLKPNEFGKIEQIIYPKFKTLLIPQTFVRTDSKGFYIYALSNSKVSKIYFKPGIVTNNGYIQVLSGLENNTSIVDSQGATLTVGEKVLVAS